MADGAGGGAGASGPSGGKEVEEGPITICGKEYKRLADGKFDVIVLGTGLKESILAGVLAMRGMNILQLDRNGYYGSDTASLNLTNLYETFRDAKDEKGQKAFMDSLGSNRDFNIDMIPKFMMSDGRLVQLLVQAGVADYLYFRKVDGSFVFKKGSGVHKMPATAGEALKTSLMGFFQKRKFKNFLTYCLEYDENNPKTHKGFNLKKNTMREIYKYFDLDDNSQDFAGHGMALQCDDSYLDKPAWDTVEALRLYGFSVQKHNAPSPFIYPRWGLGGLPEGFTRKAALQGATYMLKTDVDEILFDSDGVAKGIRCGDQAASATYIIGEPSYFPKEKLNHVGKVVRSICLLKHGVDGLKVNAAQVIIPQRQADRNHDIYLSILTKWHDVCADGVTLAIASTTAETDKPVNELGPAISMLGEIFERFDSVKDCYEPKEDGTSDRCFISKSYDATSHFESTVNDICDLFERVTGEQLIKDPAADESESHK